ncbi:unnamed protein product, partial [Ixodes hexagonus]
GSYSEVDYKNGHCSSEIWDHWLPLGYSYRDSYVVFSKPNCYVLRTVEHMGTCHLWLSESQLNKTLEHAPEEATFSTNLEKTITPKADITPGIVNNLTEIKFKHLPAGCRLAFLLSCGPPTLRVYTKENCEK